MIAKERTSKEIAKELGVARKTVDAHRSNICRKLEIHGQHVLARFAARHRSEL
jgi:DNA-binding CsgD family transcriptional regulator